MQSIVRKSPDDAAWQPWLFLAISVLALAVLVSVVAVTVAACGGSDDPVLPISPTDAVAETPTEAATATPSPTATETSTPETATATPSPTPTEEPSSNGGGGGGSDYVDDSAEVACSIGAPLDQNHRVARDCVIGPLVEVEGYLLYDGAAAAYIAMRDAAAADGITIYLVSAYRSFETQVALYWAEVGAYGPDQNTTAKPGHSEHQLGTTIDVNDLSESFGDSPAGIWMQQNAGNFGFRMSYPAGMEASTGYAYEPWHWRWWG